MAKVKLFGYAKVKHEMNERIDYILQADDSVKLSFLLFKIDSMFGLGSSCVMKRLKLLEDNGFVIIDGDTVKWIGGASR